MNEEIKKDIYSLYYNNMDYNSFINKENNKQNEKTIIVKKLFSNELKIEYIDILNKYKNIKSNPFSISEFYNIMTCIKEVMILNIKLTSLSVI